MILWVERLHDFCVRNFLLLKGCIILCVERLRDFVCREVASFFSLTHSLRLHYLFFPEVA